MMSLLMMNLAGARSQIACEASERKPSYDQNYDANLAIVVMSCGRQSWDIKGMMSHAADP